MVDETGQLSGADISEAQEGIEALEGSRGVQLWALYVATTSGETITDYADGSRPRTAWVATTRSSWWRSMIGATQCG